MWKTCGAAQGCEVALGTQCSWYDARMSVPQTIVVVGYHEEEDDMGGFRCSQTAPNMLPARDALS